MDLTLSKRFEFSSSARLYRSDLSDDENLRQYGPGWQSRYGFGYNYVVHVVLSGPVDPATGMIINVTAVKERVGELLAARYDHKYLNADTPPFGQIVPTLEELSRRMLAEIMPLFRDLTARPVALHLEGTPDDAATAYADGSVERHAAIEFSAARRTYSPRLTEAENQQLFGAAAAATGHGHNYRLRVTLTGVPDVRSGQLASYQALTQEMGRVRALLDHKNLSSDVPELAGMPVTTETISRLAFDQLSRTLPVGRVRLWELPQFSVEYDGASGFRMVLEKWFHAAHRLHSPQLPEDANLDTYGKCNNPAGHGHRYRVEAAFGGPLDERSGSLFNLTKLDAAFEKGLEPWQFRHLDLETTDFVHRPSTGENIVSVLWPRLAGLTPGLARLRLWETPNNRFTLRRS